MVKNILAVVVPLLLAGKVTGYSCMNVSFTTCEDRIVHHYDVDDGQICDPHDCGGGRAPPRTDVPGCAFYSGTEKEKTEPSYLSCFKGASSTAVPSTSAGPTTSAAQVTPTSEPSSEASSVQSAVSSTKSASGSVASSAPATTGAATLSTGTKGGSTGASSAASSASTSATGNAGNSLEGSVMAAVAAVMGAVALV